MESPVIVENYINYNPPDTDQVSQKMSTNNFNSEIFNLPVKIFFAIFEQGQNSLRVNYYQN